MTVSIDTPAFASTRARLASRFSPGVLEPWWRALPGLLASTAESWSIDLGEPVGHGETAVVVPAVDRGRTGARSFLKLTPDHRLSAAEASALDHWAPTGRVPVVLARDPSHGALLLAAVPAWRPASGQRVRRRCVRGTRRDRPATMFR